MLKQLGIYSFLMLVQFAASGQGMDSTLHNYRIVYNTLVPDTTKDDWEILSMDCTGNDKRNISRNDDVAWAYMAVDQTLFFISDRDTCYRCFFLYSMDAYGNQVRRVSDLQLEDSWISSGDAGSTMLVSGRIGKTVRYQLFSIDLTTGVYTQITNDTAASFTDPCYSPDGKQVVMSYKKNRRDRRTHEELYIMAADGSGMRQLTQYPEDNISAKDYGYRAGAAKWHPSGQYITYVSKQDGRHSIFAITPDGAKQWKLIDNPESEGWHDWSPDGAWIVYNYSDAFESRYDIGIRNIYTGEFKTLTESTVKTQLGPVFVRK